MFITFEGIDGCGKSTQISFLSDYLRNKGFEVITLREPGGTDFSESIRELLLYSKNNIISETELLLFEAARSHLVENVIKPAINSGKIVLSDRFFDSTTAYQGYGRLLPLDFIKKCNEFATSGLKPDITFYLDIPLELAHKRAHGRVSDRIEKSGDEFFLRVINGFRQISEEEPERVLLINATGSPEHTKKLIFEKIDLFLRNKSFK